MGQNKYDPARLHLHHIGGRFGTGGVPIIKAFEQDMVRVFYDADADCVDQIREKHKSSAADIRVLPYCIGEIEGDADFHINYDPTTSSLHRFNPDCASWYFFSYTHDFVVADNMRTMETRKVRTTSLDRLVRDDTHGVPPPDLLSLDVQGAEFAVLQGAQETLDRSVLAIAVETVFHPLYEGEKTFGDIHRYLADRGFHFVRFLSFIDYTPNRKPLGLRGEGFQLSTDALFMRTIESVERTVSDDFLRHVMLRKLAFLSVVYNQFEYGLECLERSAEGRMRHGQALDQFRYYAFLGQLERGVQSMPKKFPPTFSEKYSFDLSRERFLSTSQLKNSSAPRGGIVQQLWLRILYPRVHSLVKIYGVLVRGVYAEIAARVFPNSSVEKVLWRHGLKKQALLLKKNRLTQPIMASHGRGRK